MKRYDFEQQHGELGQMRLESDGEWIRYEDHVEAMKRIAGDGVQQAIPVAEVTAGNLGSRLMWHTEDAQSLTPVGTLLYASPSASAQQAEPVEWQIEVAGPAGYVRFVKFMGDTLEAALDSVRKQNFCPAPDEDGFVTMKVKV